MTSVFDSDDLLMAELELLAARFDPVPAEVKTGARAAYSQGTAWDAALAQLVFDSTTDPDDTRALVRGGTGTRELTFEGPDLTIEVEVGLDEPARSGRVRILGQLVPPTAASIEVCRADGSTTIAADRLGRFSVEGAPSGPMRLRCTPEGAAPTATEWILI